MCILYLTHQHHHSPLRPPLPTVVLPFQWMLSVCPSLPVLSLYILTRFCPCRHLHQIMDLATLNDQRAVYPPSWQLAWHSTPEKHTVAVSDDQGESGCSSASHCHMKANNADLIACVTAGLLVATTGLGLTRHSSPRHQTSFICESSII